VAAVLLPQAFLADGELLRGDKAWLAGTFGGWLEGNAVVTPEGRMVDMLRVESGYPEKAAIVKVSADGSRLSFDPQSGFVEFPGGAKTFSIRRDPKGNLYWSVATLVPERHRAAGRPGTGETPVPPADYPICSSKLISARCGSSHGPK
jgi:hypothetical protein